MRAAVVLLAVTCCGCLLWAAGGERRAAPAYTLSSIVHGATLQGGALAPNTIGTVFGQDLTFATRALSPGDIRDNTLPTLLPGTGLRVLIRNIPAHLYYVSPTQVNFLVPSILTPGPANFQIVRDGRAGPSVQIQIGSVAPGLFQLAPGIAVATRPDGSVIAPDSPARPGDYVILYATGLGQTAPPQDYGKIAHQATSIAALRDFQLLFNDVPVEPGTVGYVGLTPGFGGLYQVNLKIPAGTGPDPEIRIEIGPVSSPRGVILPLQPE
jgi:uncharacterized protein (TIGR03437 family)